MVGTVPFGDAAELRGDNLSPIAWRQGKGPSNYVKGNKTVHLSQPDHPTKSENKDGGLTCYVSRYPVYLKSDR